MFCLQHSLWCEVKNTKNIMAPNRQSEVKMSRHLFLFFLKFVKEKRKYGKNVCACVCVGLYYVWQKNSETLEKWWTDKKNYAWATLKYGVRHSIQFYFMKEERRKSCCLTSMLCFCPCNGELANGKHVKNIHSVGWCWEWLNKNHLPNDSPFLSFGALVPKSQSIQNLCHDHVITIRSF